MTDRSRTYVHVLTTDLDSSLDLIGRITGAEPDVVLDAGNGVRTALIEGFMIIAAPEEVLGRIRGAAGSVVVDDLTRAERELRQAGAEITLARAASPLGEFLYARHPDGTLFEYAQFDPDLLATARAASAIALKT